MNRKAEKTMNVEIAASTYRPVPHAIPIAATTHTVATLVSPRTWLRVCRISPAPRNPIPCTMFEATCPLFGLLSPASTTDIIVNSAAPMQIKFDPKVLRQDGQPTLVHSAHPIPGATATQVFRFTVAGLGKTQLDLDYVRPWEKGVASARTFRLDVTVS